MTPATLHELRCAWMAAKALEAKAAQERRAIEDAILAMLPSKAEGTVTDKDSGVSATFKVNRKVDSDALQLAWPSLNTNAQRAFKWKAEIDARQLKALQELDAPTYAAIAPLITATPAKPAISIKN